MLRAGASIIRANSNGAQWQQLMKISTTKSANLAAIATPQPETNPAILYTGVSSTSYFDSKYVYY